MGMGRKLLTGWRVVAARFASVQTLLILALFYFVLIGPTAILSRITGRDYLGRRPLDAAESAWLDADSAKPDLERAKLTS